MKNLNSKIILFIIFFGLFAFVSQVKTEGTTTVQLKVAAFDQVLFDNNFIVNSCSDDASSTNYTLNAWCAVDQLILSQSWTATSTWYSYGIMLNAINQYEGDYNNYWLWFSNSEPGETALNQHVLSDGEKLLLSFGTSPLKITASSTSPYINSTTILNALYFDTYFWQWQPAENSIFSINGQETPSASGIYELWINTTTTYEISAKKAGFIDSEPIAINPQLPAINIVNPLRITAATTTPVFNSATTLYLEQFGYDSNWNPAWQSAASSTFLINGLGFYSEDGTMQLLIATTSPYLIFGRKTGYLDSPILILTGIFQNETSSQPAPPDNSGGCFSSYGFNPGNAQTHRTVDINRAINFLALNQNSDGSIGSSIIYSDWAAIALSAFGNSDAKNKLKNYLSGAEYNTNGSVTDLERRAMALMALSADPYSGTATDYISKIVSAFDETQIGDPDLFNDDIFALFPLLKAGYSGSDPIIGATVKFIISKQSANGSWGNIDLTAAAIQALSLAKKTGNLDADIMNSINQSLQSAKNFLKNSQDANGGFGNNTISTSWAVQVIPALGEQVLAWENNGNNPFDFLASRQNSDGGFEDASVAADIRIWTTAYVVPAALEKTWDEILFSFPKKIQNFQNQDNTNVNPLESANNLPVGASSISDLSTSTGLAFATTSINENMPEPQNTTSTASNKILPRTVANIPEIKMETGQNLSVGESVNSIQQNEPIREDYSKNFTAQISNSIILGHFAGEKMIKIIFYLSVGASFLLGLYLIIKFLILILRTGKLSR